MPSPFTGNEATLLRCSATNPRAEAELLTRIALAEAELAQQERVYAAAGMLARLLAPAFNLSIGDWTEMAHEVLRQLPKEHRWLQWRDFAECSLHHVQFVYADGCPQCQQEA